MQNSFRLKDEITNWLAQNNKFAILKFKKWQNKKKF
jgi:hypothetical protein